MSIPLQLLLRLPPALRTHTTSPFLRQSNLTTASPKRLLTSTSPRPPSKPPKPTLRQPPKTPEPPSPPTSPRQPPKPNTLPRSTVTTPDALLAAFRTSPATHLLLYKAPPHTALYLSSYTLGAVLLTGAVSYATHSRSLPDGRAPALWLRLANLATAVFFALFGTAVFLAPWKLVRSVAVIKVQNAVGSTRGLALRFEMKHPLPVLPRLRTGGGEIITPLHEVSMDKHVRAFDRLSYFSIPPAEAQSWTEAYFSRAPPPPAPRAVLARFRAAMEALVDVWPAMKLGVRKMVWRDGMAYLSIPGRGNWKMDLQGAQLLDRGRVLERVVLSDAGAVDRTVWGWVRARL